ncbi:hypothetical protein ABK040_006397 [Willaertia magna]
MMDIFFCYLSPLFSPLTTGKPSCNLSTTSTLKALPTEEQLNNDIRNDGLFMGSKLLRTIYSKEKKIINKINCHLNPKLKEEENDKTFKPIKHLSSEEEEELKKKEILNRFKKINIEKHSHLSIHSKIDKKTNNIFILLFNNFIFLFLISLIPLFFSKICQLLQPVLVGYILNLLHNNYILDNNNKINNENEHFTNLIHYCIYLLVNRILIGLTMRWHYYAQNFLSHQITFQLYNVCYSKCVISKKRLPLNISSIFSEIGQVERTVSQVHSLFSHTFHLIGAMFIIYYEYKNAFITLTFIFTCIIVIPINIYFQSLNTYYTSKKRNEASNRVSILSNFITIFKQVKSFIWENKVEETIQNIRNSEMLHLSKLYLIDNIINCIWYTLPFMITCILIVVSKFADNNSSGTDEKTIFLILVLLDGISVPIFELPKSIMQIIYAKSCLLKLNQLFSLQNNSVVDGKVFTTLSNNNNNNNTTSTVVSPPLRKKEKLIEETAFYIKTEGTPCCKNEGKAPISLDKDFHLSANEWIVVRGKLGSGKTTLTLTLLGKTQYDQDFLTQYKEDYLKHSVLLDSNIEILYTPQEPFILNENIQENITFGLPYLSDIYTQVIKDCQLDIDLEQWNMEDASTMKQCGYAGNHLSGGQKIRISLCRCLYRYYYLQHKQQQENNNTNTTKAKYFLFILDEVFNSLDPAVASNIFIQAFQKRLRNKNNNVSIIFTASDGRFDCYMDRVYKIEQGHVKLQSTNKKKDNVFDKKKKYTPNLSRNFSSGLIRDTEEKEAIPLREETTRTISKFYFFYNFNLKRTILLVFLFILSQVLKSTTKVFLSHFNDHIVIFITLGLVRIVTELALGYVWGDKCFDISNQIHNSALGKILRVPYDFFYGSKGKKITKSDRFGDVMETFSNNVNVLDRSLPWLMKEVIQKWIECIASIATILLYVFDMNGMIVLSLLGISIISFLSIYYYHLYSRTRDQISSLYTEQRASMSQFAMESTNPGAITVIQAYNQEEYFEEKFKEKVTNVSNTLFVYNGCTDWLGVRLECIIALLLLLPFFYIIRTYNNHNNSHVEVVNEQLHYAGIMLVTCVEFFNRFLWTLVVTMRLESELPFIGKLKEYINLPTESEIQHDINDKGIVISSKLLDNNNTLNNNGFENEENIKLELNNVGYKNILNNVTCTFNQQKMYAIVGRTGSGKSSILSVICRLFYPLDEGEITFLGKNITEYELTSYRYIISMIPQDVTIGSFTNNSLRKNIDINGLFTDDEILDCLKLLGADKISKIDLDRHIEREEDISNIDKQVIFLCRVYLLVTKMGHDCKPKYLLIDEITSSMDLSTTKKVIQSIRNLCNEYGVTVIWVTHQLCCVEACDYVVCIDKGSIVEQGEVSLLLENDSSYCNELFKVELVAPPTPTK